MAEVIHKRHICVYISSFILTDLYCTKKKKNEVKKYKIDKEKNNMKNCLRE